MKTRYIALLSLVVVLVATTLTGAAAALQPDSEEQRALRARIEERYDVVPLSEGVALTPKARRGDVRLIEIADTIAINGIVVTGRELRDRVGADADAILRVSYLDPAVRRSLFAAPAGRTAPNASAPQPENRSADRRGWERHRAGGDRVRVFGDVRVGEDEAVSGQVVAVIGSVRIDGEVGDQVVAVLGSVDLGPKAVVNGDVVSVGGRVRRADGSQVRGGVTEVSLADADAKLHLGPWMGGVGLGTLFDGFGALPRLLASTFRLMMLGTVRVARHGRGARHCRSVRPAGRRRSDQVDAHRRGGRNSSRAGARPDRRHPRHLPHRHSTAAPDAVCSAIPYAARAGGFQRNRICGGAVGTPAIWLVHITGYPRRVHRRGGDSAATTRRPADRVGRVARKSGFVPVDRVGNRAGVSRVVGRVRGGAHQRVRAMAGAAPGPLRWRQRRGRSKRSRHPSLSAGNRARASRAPARARAASRQHAVAEIEDVSRASAGASQHIVGRGEQAVVRAEQQRRIEVALDAAVVPDDRQASSSGRRQSTPMTSPPASRDVAKDRRRADAEVDRPARPMSRERRRRSARVRKRELAVVGAAERAGPRIEDLQRLRAGFDLGRQVVGDHRRRSARTGDATLRAART